MLNKCKYCGKPVGSRGGNMCANCAIKINTWRELHALACHIKKLAEIERKSR